MRRRFSAIALLSAALVSPLVSGQQASSQAPRFEVASVKQSVSDSSSSSSKDSPGSYTAINMPLRRLIAIAYRIHPAMDRERIVRPSWIDGARFDINARTPAGARSDQIPDMLRALLADRFSLMTHRETREGAVFALVRPRTDGALGPQLSVSSLDCSTPEAFQSSSAGAGTASTAKAEKPACGLISTVDGNGGVLRGGGRTMADLADNLTGRMNQPVVDRTGLTGRYDFVLRWTPETFQTAAGNGGSSNDGTPIVTALQEQLGLKLERQRAPVEFLIIDRIERPSPD
jgi:uncharacterized protein (TIGR03435 family)